MCLRGLSSFNANGAGVGTENGANCPCACSVTDSELCRRKTLLCGSVPLWLIIQSRQLNLFAMKNP